MAGVFYELTREALIRRGTITIDIVTGASAGAITATLASYYLLGTEPLPVDAKKSLFYQAWVEKVDIEAISGLGKGAEKDEETGKLNWSLLSGEAIKQISDELVGNFKEKLKQAIRQKIEQGEKPFLGPLALTVTLTNLEGLLKKTDFPRGAVGDTSDQEKIKTISSAETRQFLFHSGLLNSQDKLTKLGDMWEKAELSCRASGAFPVAFPPVGDRSNIRNLNLTDLSEDYFVNPDEPLDHRKLDKDKLKGVYYDDQTVQFQYTDGGVLDGLPIVRGILVEKLLLEEGEDPTKYFGATDPNLSAFREEWRQLQLNPDERLYVYIQPTPADDLRELPRLTKDNFSMLEVGISGLTLPKEEHDAIRLENVRLRNEDARRKQELQDKVDQLFSGLDDDLKRQLEGTKQQLQKEIEKAIPYRHITLCRIDPSLLADMLHHPKLDELAKTLDKHLPAYMKQAIRNRQIKRLLASDFFGAFGGFFDRRYRDHDFLLGRICGQVWLLKNCWQTENPEDPRIQALVELIKTESKYFLADDPQPSDLIQPGRIEILEGLFWRALRILFIESRPKTEGATDEEKALVSALLKRVALKAIAVALLVIGGIGAILGALVLQILS